MTYSVIGLGVVPAFDEAVADGIGAGLICSEVVEAKAGACKGVLDVIDDGALN